jgi:hypothetical protein
MKEIVQGGASQVAYLVLVLAFLRRLRLIDSEDNPVQVLEIAVELEDWRDAFRSL